MTTGDCDRCDGLVDIETMNIEAFELSGELLCDACADAYFEEALDAAMAADEAS